tara:strand:+ start:734 stop:1171 length:438 start_codon:yes stop_codon:yes gene_type:complete
MKKIGEYSSRLSIGYKETKRVNVFDGDYTTGYKLTKIQAFTNKPGIDDANGWITVATTDSFDGATWDAANSQQIAWAGFHTTSFGGTSVYVPETVIDRENLVIEDLYIYGESESDLLINVYMEFDVYQLPPYRGSLAIVQNMAQG